MKPSSHVLRRLLTSPIWSWQWHCGAAFPAHATEPHSGLAGRIIDKNTPSGAEVLVYEAAPAIRMHSCNNALNPWPIPIIFASRGVAPCLCFFCFFLQKRRNPLARRIDASRCAKVRIQPSHHHPEQEAEMSNIINSGINGKDAHLCNLSLHNTPHHKALGVRFLSMLVNRDHAALTIRATH